MRCSPSHWRGYSALFGEVSWIVGGERWGGDVCALNVAYVLECFLDIWCESLVDVFAEAALMTVLG